MNFSLLALIFSLGGLIAMLAIATISVSRILIIQKLENKLDKYLEQSLIQQIVNIDSLAIKHLINELDNLQDILMKSNERTRARLIHEKRNILEQASDQVEVYLRPLSEIDKKKFFEIVYPTSELGKISYMIRILGRIYDVARKF